MLLRFFGAFGWMVRRTDGTRDQTRRTDSRRRGECRRRPHRRTPSAPVHRTLTSAAPTLTGRGRRRAAFHGRSRARVCDTSPRRGRSAASSCRILRRGQRRSRSTPPRRRVAVCQPARLDRVHAAEHEVPPMARPKRSKLTISRIHRCGPANRFPAIPLLLPRTDARHERCRVELRPQPFAKRAVAVPPQSGRGERGNRHHRILRQVRVGFARWGIERSAPHHRPCVTRLVSRLSRAG